MQHSRSGRALARLGAFIATAVLATSAALAAFPDKPVRLIVPFAPGGGTDIVARTLSVGMARELGQPVVVDNKPGAGTIIGTDAVAKSALDGYSLVVSTFAHAVNPSLRAQMPFDTERAFTPVILLARGPNVLVVRSDSPYKTVQDVITAAKAHPGELTYASQGNGTSAHLAGELFANLAKVQITHVPYRGAGPALTDLLGGRVNLMFATAAASSPFIASGKMRALGVTTLEPSPAFAGVPTVAQTVPGFKVESWYGIYAPAGTPAEVIARLNVAAAKAAHGPTFREKVEQEGLAISAGAPAELDAYVRAEQTRWAVIVRENGIRIE